MRKKILFAASIFFALSFVSGCRSNGKEEVSNATLSKERISHSKGFGRGNTDFFKVYEAEEGLEVFQKAFSKAVKQEGIVDMEEPEFDLEVKDKEGNKQEYHLWIGEKDETSTLMKAEDTNTIYSVLAKETNELIDLIE